MDSNLDGRPFDSDSPVLDPGPSTSRHEPHTVPVAHDSFQEKLWDALGDDDRFDAIEARLNEYAHIPQRWRGVGSQAYGQYNTEGGLEDDPALMNDDEYAEWVRVGMWKKRNAAAHHEQQRQKAAQAVAKAEGARILREKEDARRRKRDEQQRRRRVEAREAYQRRWIDLLEPKPGSADLGFGDIPWPVGNGMPDISQLTVEAISAFLFISEKELEEQGLDDTGRARVRKEELRATMLRFHPDKFEGRIIPRVKLGERAAVREGANAVTRAVAALMESVK